MSKHRDIERAEGNLEPYLDDLKTIVNIDSGTYTKAGLDRVGAYLQERFSAFGFSTRIDKQQEYGNHLIATHHGKAQNGARILLIGHIDTVFSAGEAERRPFTIMQRDGKHIATGPGILDMKSGVLIGMYGLHLLIDAQEDTYSSVTFLCNSDEEIGSPSSRPIVQELARQSDAVLVLEPGRSEGTVVSSRKGCGQYRVEVHGLSAHAGVEPEKGRNAILELSYQVQKMQALNGAIPGVTLSVGIIRGGERTNVVPDYAYFDMDVRVSDQAGLEALEAAMRNVTKQNVLPGTRITLSGSALVPPFERNTANARLVELVKEAGRELGLKIQDVGSGGASDANTSAALGIPTLDGLGAGGGLAHNPGEYIELDYLPKRIALLAGLVRKIGA
ncbi:MAG TPA: M20 family metallopeptidase [Ktedonobacteraceae bacterium]|jgi:glutamate carboxypeptidase|nr:M20 family metallopeptidase [Ktedonobacteraceae bacterium]